MTGPRVTEVTEVTGPALLSHAYTHFLENADFERMCGWRRAQWQTGDFKYFKYHQPHQEAERPALEGVEAASRRDEPS